MKVCGNCAFQSAQGISSVLWGGGGKYRSPPVRRFKANPKKDIADIARAMEYWEDYRQRIL
jgi:hypothetical protein